MGNQALKEEERPDQNDTEQKIIEQQKQEIPNKKNKKKKQQKLVLSQQQQVHIPPADKCESKIDINLDSLRFWSTFDSGNLAKVVKHPMEADHFLLTIAKDCSSRIPELINNKNLRNWFYFKTINQSFQNREITMTIINIEKKQFSQIWKSDPEIYAKQNHHWFRLAVDITNLKPKFKYNLPYNQKISFAFSVPWTYKKNLRFFQQIQPKDFYYRKELLCNSLDGLKIELITITGLNLMSQQEEDYYGDPKILFPDRSQQRPKRFDKPYIYITCRVHAAEQAASFMMKGILEMLQTEEGKPFLENFVLILIPMLNPDGVYRGHYRLDSLGYDLNRTYCRKQKKLKFPSIYGNIETALYYDRNHRVEMYFDLHAHSNCSNSFVFTNPHPDHQKQIEILLFPTIMTYYLEHFSLDAKKIFGEKQKLQQEEFEGQFADNPNIQADDCDWHPTKLPVREQRMTEQIDEEKKLQENNKIYSYVPFFRGNAKTDIYNMTSILKCYTVEANYKYYFIKQGDEIVKKKFETTDFEEIGRAIIQSILQMNNLNNKKIGSLDLEKLKILIEKNFK